MISTALREALANKRLLLATGPVVALSTALMLIIFSINPPEALPGEESHGAAIEPTEATMLALVLIATTAALALTIDRAVAHTRRRYALFEAVGMNRAGVRTLLQHQVVVITIISVGFGLVVGLLTAQPLYSLLSRLGAQHRPVTGEFDAYSLVGATVVALGLALIASAPATQLARGIEPVEAIKPKPLTPPRRSRGMAVGIVSSWSLAVVASIFVAVIPHFGAEAHPVERANQVATFGGIQTLALAAGLTLSARYYSPWLIKGWTILLPQRRLPTAFLGRRGAAYQAARSLEAFNLVAVGSLLVGSAASIYFARSALDPAGRGWVEARDMTAAFLTGVPVTLALLGAVTTAIITTRSRSVEVQTLRLAGATPFQVLLAGLFEAAIMALTALMVGLIGVAWVAASVGVGLSAIPGSEGWPGSIGWDPLVWAGPIGVALFGVLLVTICALPSVLRALRRPIA